MSVLQAIFKNCIGTNFLVSSIKLFILIELCRCELPVIGENSVDTSSLPPSGLLDSVGGVDFLAELALTKHSRSDQGLKDQDIPSNLAPGANQDWSSNNNKQFSETLSSFGEVFKSSLNQSETEKPDHTNFKTFCKRYSKKSNLPSEDAADKRSDFESLCDIVLEYQCLSTDQFLKILKEHSVKSETLTLSQAVARVCPLLLFQKQETSCPQQTEISTTDKEFRDSDTQTTDLPVTPAPLKGKPNASSVWGFGFLFVTIVSCCSLVGVALLPFLSKRVYHIVLVLFEGLAVGSLSASALFHLIPQAFGLLGQNDHHDYLWKSLVIFLGVYVFFITERCMKIIIQRKEKRKKKKALRNLDTASLTLSPSDLSSNGGINEKTLSDGNGDGIFIEDGIKKNGDAHVSEPEPDTQVCLPVSNNAHNNNHHGHSHFHATTNDATGKQEIATVAWMIIFGDGFHNFIDGLSIGAAFSDSILSGISISVAVICEEFPHELGDFAVLLSAGMTMKQALMYNFLSACTCYLGLIFGIILGDFSGGGPYIFAFAGGMFLYISLVDMVNELSEALESASEKGTKEMVLIFFLQNVGILIGMAVMFVMARFSEHIKFDDNF